jgi:hypothetical protein
MNRCRRRVRIETSPRSSSGSTSWFVLPNRSATIVVLQRRALTDDERNHRDPAGTELVDDERALDDVDLLARLLTDGEALANDLRRETRAHRAQAFELRFAVRGSDVVEDDRAEGIDEHVAAVGGAELHVTQPDLGARVGAGELAQREVFLEGDGCELVRAHDSL